jgi:hypothetical protein
MLQIVDTERVSAGCRVCHAYILDKKNVKSNLGSGKYAYHYHIDCFKREYGGIIAQIMEAKNEIDPVLVARANKPKPLWRIFRSKSTMTVRGPESFSYKYMEMYCETPKLDTGIQTAAALLGRKYYAEIMDQKRLDNHNSNMLDAKKITHIGFANGYTKIDEPLSPSAIYLVEGILKK